LVEPPSREAMIDLFAKARDARGLCEAMIEGDPTGRRIPSPDRPGLIAMALAIGKEWAAELRERYPGEAIETVAGKIGVTIEISDGASAVGGMVIRSEYYGRPPRIVLYEQSIRVLRERVTQSELTSFLTPDLITPLYILHELFHHFEWVKKDSLSKRYSVTTLRFGPLRLKSPVRVLTEMGAHAFAQNWLNLEWYPYVLDQWERLIGETGVSPVEQLNRAMTKRGIGRVFSRYLPDRDRPGSS
jgi:hypothetical protein